MNTRITTTSLIIFIFITSLSSKYATAGQYRECTYRHFEEKTMSGIEFAYAMTVPHYMACPKPAQIISGVPHTVSLTNVENGVSYYFGHTATKEACEVYLDSVLMDDGKPGEDSPSY